MVGQIATQGIPAPIQAGRRRVIERTHAWGNQYGKLRWCTERRRRVVVEFWLALANAAIVCGRLVRRAWSCYHWQGCPAAAHDHLLAQPLHSRPALRAVSGRPPARQRHDGHRAPASPSPQGIDLTHPHLPTVSGPFLARSPGRSPSGAPVAHAEQLPADQDTCGMKRGSSGRIGDGLNPLTMR
jgi:hypothetical protein